jgi:hypothetical protein
MPFTSRVFRTLESELNKNLAFSFSLGDNLRGTMPPRCFVFKAWIRNNSLISMKNVRGSIAPGPAANFKVTTFSVPCLGPHQQFEIAKIQATRLDETAIGLAFDRVATVNVVGQADLSDFWFRDSNRGLTYIKVAPLLSEDPGEFLIERLDRQATNE